MNKLPVIALCAIVSSQAFGHASFVRKDNLDEYTGRSYKEGSSANIAIALGHGCHNEDRSKWYATTTATILFPNGVDISEYAYTKSHGAQPVEYGGNAIMGIKARVTAKFKKVTQMRASVPNYYNHGERSDDVRSIHWINGYVKNEMFDNLEFRATFPKLKGCVKKLRVYTPVVQYCENGDMLAWMKNPTTNFPEAVISPGYAPYFDVVRDMSANPLDASCGEGEEKELYPSEQAIDLYSVCEDAMMNGNNHQMGGMGGHMSGTGNTMPSGAMPVDGGDGTGAGAGPLPEMPGSSDSGMDHSGHGHHMGAGDMPKDPDDAMSGQGSTTASMDHSGHQ